jgi:hypothetical protein
MGGIRNMNKKQLTLSGHICGAGNMALLKFIDNPNQEK